MPRCTSACCLFRATTRCRTCCTSSGRCSLVSSTPAGPREAPLIPSLPTDHDERIPLFLAQPDTPYPALLKWVLPTILRSPTDGSDYRLLDSQDDFVRLKSAVITSTFLSTDPKAPEAAITKVLFHLTSLLRESSASRTVA